MATDEPSPSQASGLPVRPKDQQQNEPQSFDIVRTYRDLLNSDRDITMPVAAIESLIELMRETPYNTAMELVEKVRAEKAKLIASAPNPLPILAGADLFEQYLLKSLRGQTSDTNNASDKPLSFDETRQHLLDNRQLFAQRAKAARDNIAVWGTRYVSDGKVVLTMGGSRTVTKILLRAAQDRSKHFKVIYVLDGKARSEKAVAELRAADLEVETISMAKIAYILGAQKKINLVLVGAEAITQNGGIVSGMGTAQLAALTKSIKGGMKRFYVAAETHKIVRKTPIAYPILGQLGIKQKEVEKFENLGVETVQDENLMLDEQDEVDYTEPDLIDGFITEQGIKMAWQIWEFVDDYL
ncbi:translation initiation factor eIF-2B subunit alpha [Podospora fimiseda]|uniref:Translation initiation factor eIF2B subunit alpha n=1 Tax=Podospora fimiseda TaxID=252190 RepID=A0AAN7BL18_9PEZI|nr:translation initiation factor eIF-2B subunit alpha [Podospora fimiseda]